MTEVVTEKPGHVEMWVVGERIDDEQWHMSGIFSTRELAVANCCGRSDFVFPIIPDLDITGKPGASQIKEGWPRAFYPNHRKDDDA